MKLKFFSLFIMLCLFSAISLADMIYDPVVNLIFTYPIESNINQDEYRLLLLGCIQIENNIIVINNSYPSYKELLKQFSHYLRNIGTPTALRLIDDLNKDKVFYPNGSTMRKISE